VFGNDAKAAGSRHPERLVAEARYPLENRKKIQSLGVHGFVAHGDSFQHVAPSGCRVDSLAGGSQPRWRNLSTIVGTSSEGIARRPARRDGSSRVPSSNS